MKIMIIGGGKVGEELAGILSQEKNDVTIIDINPAAVERICNEYDVMGYVGNGASYSVQLDAGIKDTDILIAVTAYDELNLLCCLIAKKAGNCKTIARVRNPEYSQEMPYLKEELGLAMIINQEMTAAREIARNLRFPTAIEIDTFAKGNVELLRFKIPTGSILNGLNLIQMHEKVGNDVLVCTVERGNGIVIPGGSYILKEGDVISIISGSHSEREFFKKVGMLKNPVKNVMIIGGGDIAFYLTQILIQSGIGVKIIERNMARCEELSEALPKATIIHGDGSSRSLLEEENLEGMDGLVALTDIDEENVILSLYAQKMGQIKTITKINHITFDEVIDSLDLDSTVSPKNLTAEYILQYVRARRNSFSSNDVESLHRIVDNRAEALEFIIGKDFSRANIPLMQLPIKKNILIASIYRKGKLIIPRGRDVLMAGDTVVVINAEKGLNDLEDIFETKQVSGS